MIQTKSQKHAFEQIKTTTQHKLFSDPKVLENLPLKLRTNTLIVGSSGGGKTEVVSAVAKSLELPLLRINTSNWSPLGSKNEPYTWNTIRKFIDSNECGIIFVDEIDKISAPRNEWHSHIRLEIHDLLDGIFPESIYTENSQSDLWNDWPNEENKNVELPDLDVKLRQSFMIFGAGAWQDNWEFAVTESSLGFLKNEEKPQKREISEDDILNQMSSELRRRFRSSLITITPMREDDYLDIIGEISKKLPKRYKSKFENRALKAIPLALKDNLQFRILEDILQEVSLEEFLLFGGGKIQELPQRSMK